MYYNNRKVMYRAENITTGEKTEYYENIIDLIRHMTKILDVRRYSWYMNNNPAVSFKKVIGRIKNNRSLVPEYVERFYYDCDGKYVYSSYETRIIIVTDNFGRMYNAHDIKKIFDTESYKIDLVSKYNRKKKLKEKDSGYRKEPVSRTGICYRGSYGRSMRYKRTRIAAEDDQCMEYGIKPCRNKTVLDAYDIEPIEDYGKSWKKNHKVRKQWMIHKKATNDQSVRHMTPDDDCDYNTLLFLDDFFDFLTKSER